MPPLDDGHDPSAAALRRRDLRQTDDVMLRLQGDRPTRVVVLAVPLRPHMKGLPDGKSVIIERKRTGLSSCRLASFVSPTGSVLSRRCRTAGSLLWPPSPTSKLSGLSRKRSGFFPTSKKPSRARLFSKELLLRGVFFSYRKKERKKEAVFLGRPQGSGPEKSRLRLKTLKG